MKNKIYYILFLLSFSLLFSQVYLPYRKGDKYGISDEYGKMFLAPSFDYISVLTTGKFVGHKKVENFYKNSYIVNSKILMKDSDYDYFEDKFNFIIAKKHNKKEIFDGNNRKEDVFTFSGKKVFENSFRFVNFLENEKKPALKNEILVLTNNLNGKYTLHLLNKKTATVTKTFFENAIEVDTDFDQFPSQLSIKYVIATESDVQKLDLNFQNGKISAENNEITNLDARSVFQRNRGYDAFVEGVKIPTYADEPPVPEGATVQTTYAKLSYWEVTSGKPETLSFKKEKSSFDYAYLKKENGKFGYFLSSEKQYLIPPKYDEIMIADGHGVFSNGFIVRNAEDFQYLVITNKEQEFITPETKMIPWFFDRDYGKKGFHLFKIFDKNGNFFCYANQEGKLYYSK